MVLKTLLEQKIQVKDSQVFHTFGTFTALKAQNLLLSIQGHMQLHISSTQTLPGESVGSWANKAVRCTELCQGGHKTRVPSHVATDKEIPTSNPDINNLGQRLVVFRPIPNCEVVPHGTCT